MFYLMIYIIFWCIIVFAGAWQAGGDAAGGAPEAARARAEAAQLARENAALRETVLALHSELFGARYDLDVI